MVEFVKSFLEIFDLPKGRMQKRSKQKPLQGLKYFVIEVLIAFAIFS